MELGLIGLGKMGGNMAVRLLQGGHRVVAYDRNPEALRESEAKGAVGAASLPDLAALLMPPRAVWTMLPAGSPTAQCIAELAGLLSPGDLIADGGNSYYRESVRRARELAARGIQFLDVGTSGGVWGLQEGYSLMVGGETTAYRRLEPLLQTLAPAPDRGYGHVGPAGAGHFVKMIHNGIEYGLMQAYAEGFELLKAKEEFSLDLHQIAEIWGQGSVVRSWLLELTAAALEADPELAEIEGYVEDSGEGRWAAQEAIELGLPAPVITLSLLNRLRSRQERPFSARLLAALRQQFGGHPVRRAP